MLAAVEKSKEKDSVSVRVAYEGTPPERKILDCSADEACETLFKDKPLLAETVVVGKKGGLQNVFVYVSKGLPDRKWKAPEKPVVVDQNCLYVPHIWGVMAKQPLEIRNGSPLLEVPHLYPKLNKEQSFSLPGGKKKTITLNRPEVKVRVKCDVHPWEMAFCHVMPHPFFGITDDQGRCSIKGLEPGKYELTFWQEKLGVVTKKLEVEAGKTAKIEDLTSKSFKRPLRKRKRPSRTKKSG